MRVINYTILRGCSSLSARTLEVLLVRIRNDVSVRGFKFKKIEIKLTSFTEDFTFLVEDVDEY